MHANKYRNYITFSVIGLMLISASVFISTLIAPRPITKIVIVSNKPKEIETKLAELEYKTKMMAEFHSSILDTVYWALGLTATVCVLLIGYGWVTNFKMRDEDKKAISDEMSENIQNISLVVDGKLDASKLEVYKAVDSKYTQQRDEIFKYMEEVKQEAVKSFAGIQAVSSLINEQDKKVVEIAANLGERFVLLDKKISTLEYSLRAVEVKLWDTRGVPGNVVLTLAQSISASIDADHEPFMNLSISEIKEAITDNFIRKNETLLASTVQIIKNTIKPLEKKRPVEYSEIISLIDQIKLSDS